MIHCTPAAAATIGQARDRQGIPPDFGVRVFAAESSQGDVGLGLEFAPGPAAGDQVAEEHGIRLMVAAEVANDMPDLTLDVQPSPSADGDSPAQLVLRRPGPIT
jgi:Fe-S cluster assembly iron-binding protein IscA